MMLQFIANLGYRISEWAERRMEERHILTLIQEQWTGTHTRRMA